MSRLDDMIEANEAEADGIGPVEMDEFARTYARMEDEWEDAITRGLSSPKLPYPPDDPRLRIGPRGFQALGDDGEWRDV